MAWKKPIFFERIPDVLRLIVAAAFLVNLIILAGFSIWFTFRGCEQIVEICRRWIFVLK